MKIAVVTGASAGMGREFARQIPYFYRNLDEISVIARRRDRLVSLSEEGMVPCRIFQGDLLKDDVYRELEQALTKEKPDIRMLVNAAGFGKTGRVEEIAHRQPGTQMEMIDLNCRALTRMTLLCLPFLKLGSRIVNLASAAAFCPQPSFAVYAATKSYVLSFSRALRAELKGQAGRHGVLRCIRQTSGYVEGYRNGKATEGGKKGTSGCEKEKRGVCLRARHEGCQTGRQASAAPCGDRFYL